jgi:ribosomal protein L13
MSKFLLTVDSAGAVVVINAEDIQRIENVASDIKIYYTDSLYTPTTVLNTNAVEFLRESKVITI